MLGCRALNFFGSLAHLLTTYEYAMPYGKAVSLLLPNDSLNSSTADSISILSSSSVIFIPFSERICEIDSIALPSFSSPSSSLYSCSTALTTVPGDSLFGLIVDISFAEPLYHYAEVTGNCRYRRIQYRRTVFGYKFAKKPHILTSLSLRLLLF